jgi:DNA-binding LytR/AlgR family response regulator
MIKTAIVEDEEPAFQTLKEYLEKFGKENNVDFSITHYSEGLSFLEECEGYDLVFMDIELPNLNGMDIATKLREKDARVALIFVTNMVQYAIRGYSVDAIDYVLKPIQYNRFYSLMMKVSRVISANQERELVLKTTAGVKKIPLSTLLYVQITDHLLIYKTETEELEAWSSLANAEKELPAEMFCRCNNSTIINLKQVTSFDKEFVYLTKSRIEISVSRSKRKGVLQLLNAQMGI